MEKKDRATSVRKAGTSAIKKTGTSAVPKAGRAGAAPRKGGAGERMMKTAKPPSAAGKAVKLLLTAVVFIGIPAIVAAGFFVKLKNGRIVWHQLAINLGVMKAPAKAKVEKELHPNFVGYRQIIVDLGVLKNEMVRIQRVFKEHDEAQPWDKEVALKLHDDLEAVRVKIGELNDRMDRGGVWLKEYHGHMEAAEEAFKGFAGDEVKKKAAYLMTSGDGTLPPELEEAGGDESVKKYVEACLAMERNRYQDVDLKAEEFDNQQRDALTVMKQVRAFIGQLPSRDVLEGKVPPPPPAPEPVVEAPKPEPKPEPKPAEDPLTAALPPKPKPEPAKDPLTEALPPAPPKPEPKPEPAPEPKPEPKPEPAPEPKPEPKPEPVEPKPEPKPEPPPPPAETAEMKARKAYDAGLEAYRVGAKLYLDVVQGLTSPPKDNDGLQALLDKASGAVAELEKARENFVAARAAEPDVDSRLANIQKAIGNLQKKEAEIRSLMK